MIQFAKTGAEAARIVQRPLWGLRENSLKVQRKRLDALQDDALMARRAAEESLHQAQQNLDRLMASITDSLWTGEIDSQGRIMILYVSPVIEQITGYPVEYFLGDVDFGLRIVCPEDRPWVKEAYTRINSGQTSTLEIECLQAL